MVLQPRHTHVLHPMINNSAFVASAAQQTLIIFSSVDEKNDFCASGCESLGAVELSGVRPRSAMVRLTPRAELVEEYRTRFFGQSAGGAVKERNLRQIETGKEQTRIVEVVTKESELQRRVQEKRERFAAKVIGNIMLCFFIVVYYT